MSSLTKLPGYRRNRMRSRYSSYQWDPTRSSERPHHDSPMRKIPFKTAILADPLPASLKVTNLGEYDGTDNPQEHLVKFYAKTYLYNLSDATFCKVFRTMLLKRVLIWFNQLLMGSITNLEQLMQSFLHYFSINKKYSKTIAYLFTIFQKEREPLREYMQRFCRSCVWHSSSKPRITGRDYVTKLKPKKVQGVHRGATAINPRRASR